MIHSAGLQKYNVSETLLLIDLMFCIFNMQSHTKHNAIANYTLESTFSDYVEIACILQKLKPVFRNKLNFFLDEPLICRRVCIMNISSSTYSNITDMYHTHTIINTVTTQQCIKQTHISLSVSARPSPHARHATHIS